MMYFRPRAIVALCCLCVFSTETHAEPFLSLSPQTPVQGTKSRQATYQVDFRVVITAPAKTHKLRIWLPLPPSDDCQQISDRHIETFPRAVEPQIATEGEFGNTFACFEFDSPDGAVQIRHQFTAQISQTDWDVDYSAVVQPDKWPATFDRFQRPDPRSSQASELRAVLNEIEASSPSNSDRLINAIRWVDNNLSYDHRIASLSADPMHALVHRRGHCSDYHGLCGTLTRAIGYPSRVSYGLQMFDKGSPSHCKVEVFLPPYGWVSYDLSETQKLALKISADPSLTAPQREARVRAVKHRTMRGFRENTWLLVTRGVNYELAPRAAKAVTIVRTIYAEADGVALPEPDPANPHQRTFAWMTMHRVDEVGIASKRFQVIP